MKDEIRNIALIGAGNIGSRHLQAVKKVSSSLDIFVVDPSEMSLDIAKERYDQIEKSKTEKNIFYMTDISKLPKTIDLAIIATNSNIRRNIIESLLSRSNISYMILEKILFQNISDYTYIGKLFKRKHCQAYVNCSMRTMPFYHSLYDKFKNLPLTYTVTGSLFGLITNSIHYIDHMAYLTGFHDYTINTSGLDPKIIMSKRKGFMEINGTMQINFKQGNIGTFSCYPTGNAPVVIEITSPEYRVISIENEHTAWISDSKTKYTWKKIKTNLPYQSDMTTTAVNNLFNTGICNLTPYSLSKKLHTRLIKQLSPFLKKHLKTKSNPFPFT